MVQSLSQQGRLERQVRDRIRSAREAAGLSQEELGKALGLSKAGYGHYERGTVPFSLAQVFALSHILGRSVEWLLGLDTGLSEEEDRLLSLYRTAPPGAKRVILTAVEGMVEAAIE